MFRFASLFLLAAALAVQAHPGASVRTSLYTKFPTPRLLPDGRAQPGVYDLGTGTVVKVEPNRFWVLTNAHTLLQKEDGETLLEVTFSNGKTYPASVYATSLESDLGLAYVDAKVEVKLVELDPADILPKGTEVVKYGWGSGRAEPARSSVASYWQFKDHPNVKLVQLTSKSLHGDSGSGLFRVLDGRLAGVVCGNAGNAQAVSAKDVRAFLVKAEQALQKAPPAPPVVPVPTTKGGPRPGSNRVPTKVLDGSTAELARPLPPMTDKLLVDLSNLKVRFVRVGDKVYEVSVKEVAVPGAVPKKKPEEIKVLPKELKKEEAPVKE